MAETKIEWAHFSFNPWEGCQKVGPGCDHCYAEARDQRFTGGAHWGPGAPRRRTSPANWRKPLAWDRAAAAAGERHRVFCASLADVFDNAVDPAWRDDLWRLIERTPNLDWMLLTKRPGNIANMLPVPFDFERLYPNVWLGCTVVNQDEADRDIPKLLAVSAAVRFLSMEPLLGQVRLDQVAAPHGMAEGQPWLNALTGYAWDNDGDTCPTGDRLDLVIVGGESGPGARPMHPDWVRSLREQCVAAGVPFFFKQWGEWETALDREQDDPDWRADYSRKFADKGSSRWINLEGGRGFHGDRFHVMRRVGKKAAGRLLDGRTWDEMPAQKGGE